MSFIKVTTFCAKPCISEWSRVTTACCLLSLITIHSIHNVSIYISQNGTNCHFMCLSYWVVALWYPPPLDAHVLYTAMTLWPCPCFTPTGAAWPWWIGSEHGRQWGQWIDQVWSQTRKTTILHGLWLPKGRGGFSLLCFQMWKPLTKWPWICFKKPMLIIPWRILRFPL